MKKLIIISFTVILSICSFVIMATEKYQQVFAEEIVDHEISKSDDKFNIMPLGIFTSLSLDIGVENGQVYAKAKNKISIFPSSVRVYVRLYSSQSYQESYHTMTLESENFTEDLNMGKTISTYASINGVKRYWQARIYYKIDNLDWNEKVTSVWLIDVDGTATMV